MASRFNRARKNSKTGPAGIPQLTLAQLIVVLENLVRIFAKPLAIALVFVALSWFGLFASLYPWAHLVALVLVTLLFFEALGKARRNWKPASQSDAKRRVEDASNLAHRPLDVLEDRPVTLEDQSVQLWQAHKECAQEQVKNLRWPRWKLSFAENDPYAMRYALLVLLVVGGIFGWGALGGRMLAAINPALGKLQILNPTLDAWITPPDYTHLPPVMIATPAGMRHDGDTIDVPEGSVITAHIADKDEDAPDLVVNGATTAFDNDDHQGFGAAAEIRSGDKITIRRGWQVLGSWRIHVVPDQAPQIALTDAPVTTERKAVRLAYDATDDYGVTSVVARITPRESLPGASNEPVDVTLASPDAKDVKRVTFEDLTSHPWAGLSVQIQLIASDASGHTAQSNPVDFTLPERAFFNPVARALIEERKKLLQRPDDEATRTEAANVMAGVAHQASTYHGDPVVLMALRSGAVRLVLDQDHEAVPSVNGLLWESAIRIEDGNVGLAEQNLRAAQKELAAALDRNASEQEIQQLIDRLHQALAQYLSELSTRMASRPGPVDDITRMLGPQTNMLTPQDLDQMLQNMRNLSASGAHEAARAELSKLQQMLENMQTERPQFSEEQKQALRQMLALRELTRQQQDLLTKTFQNAQSGDKASARKLASEQSALLRQLQELMGLKGSPESLGAGENAMKQAGGDLQQGQPQAALPHQNDAVQALQKALQSMANNMRAGMMMAMPGMGGMGQGHDPFGRGIDGLPADDGSVKVPDQMETRKVREILDELQRRAGEMGRSKAERDYIERLLQNF